MRSRRSSDRFNLPDGIVIDRAAFGLIGIGTMGSNLALNLEDHGISVAFWNREQEKSRSFAAANPDRDFLATTTFAELVAAIERPRRILMMIPAGAPVDQTLTQLVPLLEEGDVVIDGGNSLFHDTRRRGAGRCRPRRRRAAPAAGCPTPAPAVAARPTRTLRRSATPASARATCR